MRVFVTGGAGYCGTALVERLLEDGYEVTVYDTFWFGNHLPNKNSPNLEIVRGDIRDIDRLSESCRQHDYFINLACVSNDASFELNEDLSTSVNLLAFKPMVRAAKSNGIRRFIHASSSSVYGVSELDKVKEDHPLVPLTLYNKYKALVEPMLLEEATGDFEVTIFRPATVCGPSKRQRFDLSVNILTNLAVNKREVTVFGGEQKRPNIHIQDYVELVRVLMDSEANLVQGEIFNAGNENLTILEIAKIVVSTVTSVFPKLENIQLVQSHSDDLRSYHIDSQKVFMKLGFKATKTVEQAVRDLCAEFKSGNLPNSLVDNSYYNVKKMKELNVR